MDVNPIAHVAPLDGVGIQPHPANVPVAGRGSRQNCAARLKRLFPLWLRMHERWGMPD